MSVKILDSKEAVEGLCTKINSFVENDTEESFESLDTLLNQYGRFDLIKIIQEFDSSITRKSLANKENTQLRASINILAIDKFEKAQA